MDTSGVNIKYVKIIELIKLNHDLKPLFDELRIMTRGDLETFIDEDLKEIARTAAGDKVPTLLFNLGFTQIKHSVLNSIDKNGIEYYITKIIKTISFIKSLQV